MQLLIRDSGYYRVAKRVVVAIPFGRVLVRNPKFRWWKLWQKEFIYRPVFRYEYSWEGREIVLLMEGTVVELPTNFIEPVRPYY
jgi:hypothetical protein